MSTHRALMGAGESGSGVTNIIDGKPWIASSVRNNNLRQHCRALWRALLPPHPATQTLKPFLRRLLKVVEERSRILTGLHPNEFACASAMFRVAAYADQWLRLPETWEPDSHAAPLQQWRDLLRHLFQAYPLPEFFHSAWLTFGTLQHIERDWYCHAAAGRSLRSAQGMPPSITAKALHLLMQAPPQLTIRQGLRWAQAAAAGCPASLKRNILESAMVNDLSNDRLWVRLMEKVLAARYFDHREWSLLVDGLQHVIQQEGVRRASQLLDLPLKNLRRHCRNIFETLLAAVQNEGGIETKADLKKSGFRRQLQGLATASWPSMLAKNQAAPLCYPDLKNDCFWTFQELTKFIHLQAESRALRHCVATYHSKCKSGRAAIFSLRCQVANSLERPSSVLTIEVDPRTRCIRQIRGKWDRRPWLDEWPIVRDWANRHKLLFC